MLERALLEPVMVGYAFGWLSEFDMIHDLLLLLYHLFYLKQMSLVPNIKYKTEYCLYW